jgi:hypothetical protein
MKGKKSIRSINNEGLQISAKAVSGVDDQAKA